MHHYTKVNLKHPLVTAYKVDKAAQEAFKKKPAGTSGSDQDNIRRWDARVCMQILGCASGFERMGY